MLEYCPVSPILIQKAPLLPPIYRKEFPVFLVSHTYTQREDDDPQDFGQEFIEQQIMFRIKKKNEVSPGVFFSDCQYLPIKTIEKK